MKRSWLALTLLCTAALPLSAQDPVITPETPVTSAMLHDWLHGSDPRLIAWAADFARRTHNTAILDEMPALLEHSAMPPLFGDDESQQAQRRAILAVLDALIQTNAVVPIPAIKAIATGAPAQAVILISRLPLSESRETLEYWTYQSVEDGSPTGHLLARASKNSVRPSKPRARNSAPPS
jgi:hypothetical protein